MKPPGRRPAGARGPKGPRGKARGGHRRRSVLRFDLLGRGPRWLLGFLLVAGGVVAALVLAHRLGGPRVRGSLEEAALVVLEPARESDAPLALARLADRLADLVPSHVGPTALVPEETWTQHVAGGVPRPPSGAAWVYLANAGYVALHDEAWGTTRWVGYRTVRSEARSGPERPVGFLADSRVTDPVTARLYEGSGYDRGHLAPSYAIGRDHGGAAQAETFLMTNVVPQRPELNRGLWRRLERRAADRQAYAFDEVWVQVGPVFSRALPPVLLGGRVPVPEAFFFVLADRRPGSAAGRPASARVQAYLVPHDRGVEDEPAASFLVTVAGLEAATGLDFFPAWNEQAQTLLENHRGRRAW